MSFQSQIKTLSDKVNHKYQEREVGKFDGGICGSNLFLSGNETVVSSSMDTVHVAHIECNNFVAIPLIDGCKIKLTLLRGNGSAHLVFANSKKPQSSSYLMWLDTSGTRRYGTFSPPEPGFPPITGGCHFTIELFKGRAIICTPSTSNSPFSTPVPEGFDFGLRIHCIGQKWKLERVCWL
ncbi:hypothetical protein GEMRC1_005403 [Eukaryota sp. GEM-RC1]